jgi:hypothetical protein
MQWLKRIGILSILASGLILALSGCAGKPVNKTFQAEKALAAAGLQLKMAGTPAKLDRIRRMPQKQVVRAMIKDREVYIWADGEGCECYYVGTRQNDEQLRHNQREEKADRRIDWYNAQHDDPLWLHRGWDDYFFF